MGKTNMGIKHLFIIMTLCSSVVFADNITDSLRIMLGGNTSVSFKTGQRGYQHGGHQGCQGYSMPTIIERSPVIVVTPPTQTPTVFEPTAQEYIEKGKILGKEGQIGQALECFNKASALEPDNVDAHYYLGVIYMKLGEKESAQAEYDVIQTIVLQSQQKAERLLSIIKPQNMD